MDSIYWRSMVVALAVASGCARPLQQAQRVSTTNVATLRSAFGTAAETATASAAPVISDPTGWATLKGTFKLSGTAPERPQLNHLIDKDQAVCMPGGKPVLSDELVVDSATQGIRDVVIYLSGPAKFPVGDPKWVHEEYLASKDTTLVFDQKQCIFLTPLLAMRSSQKLNILNSDPVGHNTKIDATGRTQQLNATIPANGNTLYEPKGEAQEPFNVSCAIHPWMGARMIVRDSPHFAVTKADGSFEIKHVPAGVQLEFRVWQAKSKFLQDVSVDGKPQKWNRGRFKLQLKPDEPKELNVVVDAKVFGN